MERLQLTFTCHAPYIDETIAHNEHPKAASQRLAKAKAITIQAHYSNTNTLIIGCDQVAYSHDGEQAYFLSKPGSFEKAKQQLQRASGNKVSFYTSFYLYQTQSDVSVSHTDITEVHYRNLTHQEIDNYLAHEDVLNCAGSAKVEGLGISLLEKVDSIDPTALIGLPLIALNKALIKVRG